MSPAGAGEPEARRFERQIATRDSALEMSENRKNEQIKRFFFKSMPNWLKPKIIERPGTENRSIMHLSLPTDCNKGDV